MCQGARFRRKEAKNKIVEKSLQNIWWELKKVVPLHSLSGKIPEAVKKEAIFDILQNKQQGSNLETEIEQAIRQFKKYNGFDEAEAWDGQTIYKVNCVPFGGDKGYNLG